MQAATHTHNNAIPCTHQELASFMCDITQVDSDERYFLERHFPHADFHCLFNSNSAGTEAVAIAVYSGECCIIQSTPARKLSLGSVVSVHHVEEYASLIDEMDEAEGFEELPGFAITYGRHWLLGNMVGISTIRDCYIVREHP
ncbi:hypothetical protein ACIKP9_00150 [Methylobacillus methanolivorans]|uniref:Uncharacterized protein n=1 Tax=Methylobacillus methanolivorans TaxID=1848927 RepID=A0ABW8GGY0_9PROT